MKEKIKKLGNKNIILIVVILLVLVLGGALAYFAWSSTSENKNIDIDVAILGGKGECLRLEDNNKLLVPTSLRENGRIIKLKANQKVAPYATISWDMVVNRLNKVGTTTNGLRHESFKYELVNSTTGTSYGSGNFANVNDGDTITFSSSEKLKYNTDYTFILYLWIDGTIGVNPSDMSDQTFDIDMNCTLTGAEATDTGASLASEMITNLFETNTTVTNNNIDYEYDTTHNLMKDIDGNIRYYGANPNNYIYFNCDDYSNQTSDSCELWRIIGVFGDKVKLIRNEELGELSWDYDYNNGNEETTCNNNWTTSSLQTLLNNQYYNNIDTTYYSNNGSPIETTLKFNTDNIGIKNGITRNMITSVTWPLGGWSYGAVYSNDAYRYERGTTVYEGNPLDWNGKVTLMYPSDYGYAADFSKCSQPLYNYIVSDCLDNDWLYNSKKQWLLTPHFGTNSSVYSVIATDDWGITIGGVGISAAFTGYGVRPVLYLDSELKVEPDGDGSSTNPYKLVVG